jgi:hypothetical protein
VFVQLFQKGDVGYAIGIKQHKASIEEGCRASGVYTLLPLDDQQQQNRSQNLSIHAAFTVFCGGF